DPETHARRHPLLLNGLTTMSALDKRCGGKVNSMLKRESEARERAQGHIAITGENLRHESLRAPQLLSLLLPTHSVLLDQLRNQLGRLEDQGLLLDQALVLTLVLLSLAPLRHREHPLRFSSRY